MKNPSNNSGKIFRWYNWVPSQYQYWTAISSMQDEYHRYLDSDTIDFAIYWPRCKGDNWLVDYLGDQEPQLPVKSGYSSIWKDSLNVSILRLVKIMQVTSHRDVIAAFKARWLFLTIHLEILCNFYKEKCEINAFENSDTFNSWFCDFLFWRLFC